ncbi:MAG TPA: hypothetical protein VJB06_04760, partial [archaeon]|nr:hypothetical protein [archaeon]
KNAASREEVYSALGLSPVDIGNIEAERKGRLDEIKEREETVADNEKVKTDVCPIDDIEKLILTDPLTVATRSEIAEIFDVDKTTVSDRLKNRPDLKRILSNRQDALRLSRKQGSRDLYVVRFDGSEKEEYFLSEEGAKKYLDSLGQSGSTILKIEAGGESIFVQAKPTNTSDYAVDISEQDTEKPHRHSYPDKSNGKPDIDDIRKTILDLPVLEYAEVASALGTNRRVLMEVIKSEDMELLKVMKNRERAVRGFAADGLGWMNIVRVDGEYFEVFCASQAEVDRYIANRVSRGADRSKINVYERELQNSNVSLH